TARLELALLTVVASAAGAEVNAAAAMVARSVAACRRRHEGVRAVGRCPIVLDTSFGSRSVFRWNGTADARPRCSGPFPAKPVEHRTAGVRRSRSLFRWCTLLLLGFVTRRSFERAAQRRIGQTPYALSGTS